MIGTQRRPSEKTGITFEKWNPDLTEFQPHPFSLEVYGEPTTEQIAEMRNSILANGLITPILVWQKYVLSGCTRWAAMRQLHEEFPDRKEFQYIPTNTFDGTDVEAEQKIIEANRQRVKTESQKDAEAAALLRIETELAKQRQKQGRTNLSDPSDAGRAVDKVAAVTGESAGTVRKRVKIHAAKLPPTKRNRQSTNRAFENLPKPTACDVCQQQFDSKGDMKNHRKLAHVDEMERRKTAWMNNKPETIVGVPSEPTSEDTVQSSFYVLRRPDGQFFNDGYGREYWTADINDAERLETHAEAEGRLESINRDRHRTKTPASEIRICKVEARYRLTEVSVESVGAGEPDGTQAVHSMAVYDAGRKEF